MREQLLCRLSMQRPARVIFFVVAVSWCLTGPALAHMLENGPTAGDAAQQFKSGADRAGRGAAQIGQGFKQGAIVTWEAVRDGVASFVDRFNRTRGTSANNYARPIQKPR